MLTPTWKSRRRSSFLMNRNTCSRSGSSDGHQHHPSFFCVLTFPQEYASHREMHQK
jgi:hypothetical protein